MPIIRNTLKTTIISCLLSTSAFSFAADSGDNPPISETVIPVMNEHRLTFEDGFVEQMGKGVLKGRDLLSSAKPVMAIEEFDKVISSYTTAISKYKDSAYCARSTTESLYYLAEGALKGKDAVVAPYNYAEALYLKAYALIELGQLTDAKSVLNQVLEIAPQNAIFWAELGHIFETEHDWPQAMQAYKNAEMAATNFSPDKSKNSELGRALRGQGYVSTELGFLDDSEKLYMRCLKLNPADAMAASELKYISKLRKSKKR